MNILEQNVFTWLHTWNTWFPWWSLRPRKSIKPLVTSRSWSVLSNLSRSTDRTFCLYSVQCQSSQLTEHTMDWAWLNERNLCMQAGLCFKKMILKKAQAGNNLSNTSQKTLHVRKTPPLPPYSINKQLMKQMDRELVRAKINDINYKGYILHEGLSLFWGEKLQTTCCDNNLALECWYQTRDIFFYYYFS